MAFRHPAPDLKFDEGGIGMGASGFVWVVRIVLSVVAILPLLFASQQLVQGHTAQATGIAAMTIPLVLFAVRSWRTK